MSEKEPGAATPEQEAKAALRAAMGMRALVKTEGFAILEATLQNMRNNWVGIALQPAESEAAALRTEFAKGAVHGLTLALGLPSGIIGQGQEVEAEAELASGKDE